MAPTPNTPAPTASATSFAPGLEVLLVGELAKQYQACAVFLSLKSTELRYYSLAALDSPRQRPSVATVPWRINGGLV